MLKQMTLNKTIEAVGSAMEAAIQASRTGLDDSTRRKLWVAFDALNQPHDSRTVLAGEFRLVCGKFKTLGIFEGDVFQPAILGPLVADLQSLERRLSAERDARN